MSIESLKRWHWALIGLILGLLIAWSQIQIGVDGMFAAGERKTIGQLDFERGLRQPPIRNYPIIKNLIVYPDGKRFVLRMKRFEPHPRFPGDHRGYRYVDYSLVTTQPYLPTTDLKKTVEVVILPPTAKSTSIFRQTGARWRRNSAAGPPVPAAPAIRAAGPGGSGVTPGRLPAYRSD